MSQYASTSTIFHYTEDFLESSMCKLSVAVAAAALQSSTITAPTHAQPDLPHNVT